MSKGRLALVTAALALWMGSASAVTLPFFLTLNGTNGGSVLPPFGSTVYQLWVDPSAISGGTFGFDFSIFGAGGFNMTAFTANSAALLTPTLNTTANTFQGNGGDGNFGNFTPLELGTLTIKNTGPGNGSITLWGGDYVDSNFNLQPATTPQLLAGMDLPPRPGTPEPSTLLLLGAGLGGLALAVRARRARTT